MSSDNRIGAFICEPCRCIGASGILFGRDLTTDDDTMAMSSDDE